MLPLARTVAPLISRPTLASSSRLAVAARAQLARPDPVRALSFLPRPPPYPFFAPGGYPPPSAKARSRGSGSGPESERECEVDDREWEMRVARAMLHLRDTLPRFFDGTAMADLFPPDIYSRDVALKLPVPIPVKITGLQAYSMTFSIARNGMQALHTDLHTHLERMTFSPLPAGHPLARRTTTRNRQIRVQVSIHGSPRLPPHKEATWQTSSLYSFCPRTGLIASHEVEAVRPLPGEGVAEWLLHRLLGRQPEADPQPQPCRSVAVPTRVEAFRRRLGE
ncbi:hypothetical protein Q5752_005659 [Cryptotrichosporon argae]